MDPHIPHVVEFRRVISYGNGTALGPRELNGVDPGIVEIAMARSCASGGKRARK